jgi:hypothetical protein
VVVHEQIHTENLPWLGCCMQDWRRQISGGYCEGGEVQINPSLYPFPVSQLRDQRPIDDQNTQEQSLFQPLSGGTGSYDITDLRRAGLPLPLVPIPLRCVSHTPTLTSGPDAERQGAW